MIAAAYAIALSGLATLMLAVPAQAQTSNGTVFGEKNKALMLASNRRHGARHHRGRHHYRGHRVRGHHFRGHRYRVHRYRGHRVRHHRFRHHGFHRRHHFGRHYYRSGWRHHHRWRFHRHRYHYPSFYFSVSPFHFPHRHSYYYSRFYYDYPPYYRYRTTHFHGKGWKNARSGRVPHRAVVSHFRNGHAVYGCKVMYRKAWRYGYVGRTGCHIRHGRHPVVLKHYKVLVRF